MQNVLRAQPQMLGTAGLGWCRISLSKSPGPGPWLRQSHSRSPVPGSQQQADPVFFLPLCFLQGTEGHLGCFPEDIFYILPKLGGTFQIERSSHLFTGIQTLGGDREKQCSLGEGSGASQHPLRDLGVWS